MARNFHEAKLVVEINGGYHENNEQKERDEGKTYELSKYNIKTIRFNNEAVLNNINQVLVEIRLMLINK